MHGGKKYNSFFVFCLRVLKINPIVHMHCPDMPINFRMIGTLILKVVIVFFTENIVKIQKIVLHPKTYLVPKIAGPRPRHTPSKGGKLSHSLCDQLGTFWSLPFLQLNDLAKKILSAGAKLACSGMCYSIVVQGSIG